MRKKVIIALVCVAVAVGGCFLCLYKGRDEVTFIQRQYINQYLSKSPFATDEDGRTLLVPVAVASQTDGYSAGEFLGARNQLDYRTGCIEVKVAVTDSNTAVLADSYSSIGENPAELRRVIEQMEKDSAEKLVVNLSEYSRLSAINYVLTNSFIQTGCIITGVDEYALEYIVGYFPKLHVMCNYSKNSERSLEEIKQAGAAGIFVAAESINKALFQSAKELDLAVWVDCGAEVYDTVRALKFGADGIVSSRPDFADAIVTSWHESSFDSYFGIY